VGAVERFRYADNEAEGTMWYFYGLGAVIYIVLLLTCGIMTLRNGHGWLFFFGIFIPILWIIGAIMRPANASY
jgi:hypothetical protein